MPMNGSFLGSLSYLVTYTSILIAAGHTLLRKYDKNVGYPPYAEKLLAPYGRVS